VVDTHVHVNEPGRTEWEGFETATRAAAAGGVTTILDMPLNSIPPTTTVDALREKRSAAEGKVHVDVGFWGGAVPGDLGTLRELHDAGVFGFKCFLCPSGVDEFGSLELEQLGAAAAEIAAFDGLLIVHAELPPIERATTGSPAADPFAYAPTSLAAAEAEEQAIAAVAEASAATGCRTHVLHLSAATGLDDLARRRTRVGRDLPALPDVRGRGDPRRRAPRTSAPRRSGSGEPGALWDGLRDGRIAAVVSDHSPCTADLKAGSFFDAWGGIASWSSGSGRVDAGSGSRVRARGRGPVDERGPGRDRRPRTQGGDREGRDADLVLFETRRELRGRSAELHHRNPVTPYAGRRLDGRVSATYVRGVEVYADGRFRDEPAGRLLSRGAA
jgi:allantoinase